MYNVVKITFFEAGFTPISKKRGRLGFLSAILSYNKVRE
jgi:hypothetical protein